MARYWGTYCVDGGMPLDGTPGPSDTVRLGAYMSNMQRDCDFLRFRPATRLEPAVVGGRYQEGIPTGLVLEAKNHETGEWEQVPYKEIPCAS